MLGGTVKNRRRPPRLESCWKNTKIRMATGGQLRIVQEGGRVEVVPLE